MRRLYLPIVRRPKSESLRENSAGAAEVAEIMYWKPAGRGFDGLHANIPDEPQGHGGASNARAMSLSLGRSRDPARWPQQGPELPTLLDRFARVEPELSGAILAGFVSLSVQGPVIARSLEARHVAGCALAPAERLPRLIE